MNTTLLAYKNNDEIASIMNKKFACQFKSEADSINFSTKPKFSLSKDDTKENYETKINEMNYIFPSLPIQNIEQLFNNNKDLSIEEGIRQLKEMTISENKKKETQNIINNNSMFKKSRKRNYNSFLSEAKAMTQRESNINLNKLNQNNNNLNNICNIGENHRINIFENKIIEKQKEKELEKAKEKERNKLELKTVDKLAEDLLYYKNNKEGLKKYLFNQLALLDAKKKKDRIIQNMKNRNDELDQDYLSLNKCCTTIINPINKKTRELNILNNTIKDLEENIDKVKKNIKFYEYLGNLFLKNNEY
jgi:hypothetical protein